MPEPLRLVAHGCTTKKTSNKLICVEKGARCRACNLPERETCAACGRAKAGRHVVAPAENYRLWSRTAIPELRVAWAGRPPITGDVHVRAVFYRERNVGDAVGYFQALADVLQDAGVLQNDRQIVNWDGSRISKDAADPRVEVWIEADQLELLVPQVRGESAPEAQVRHRVMG